MRMIEALLGWFSPFRLMKDVSRGTREERIAAYRHNRHRRGELTGYMRRWTFVLAAAALLTEWFDALGGAGGRAGVPSNVFVYLTAACATFLVYALCVLSLTAYVYLYLTTHDS
jgi:hypothetical protein